MGEKDEKALATVRKNLAREVSKGKLTAEEAEAAAGRIGGTTDLDSLASASLAVEAATERFEIKAELFKKLDIILNLAFTMQ